MNFAKKPLKQLTEINFLIKKKIRCMYFHTSDTSGFMKKQLKFLKANEDFMKEFPSFNTLWQNWNPVL